jgi:hypothetical protein
LKNKKAGKLPGFYDVLNLDFVNGQFDNWINEKHSATLCRLGLGLGDPWVTQASPKGDPSVTHGSRKGRFWVRRLFSTKAGKRPGGVVLG